VESCWSQEPGEENGPEEIVDNEDPLRFKPRCFSLLRGRRLRPRRIRRRWLRCCKSLRGGSNSLRRSDRLRRRRYG
jgi:hypothetical protein